MESDLLCFIPESLCSGFAEHIFKSVENVNIDTVIAWKKGGEKHHFLDSYDKMI